LHDDVNMTRKRKPRKCRICKRRPVWKGGDVKDPGPFCKKCYHKHVWSDRKGRANVPRRSANPDPLADFELPECWPDDMAASFDIMYEEYEMPGCGPGRATFDGSAGEIDAPRESGPFDEDACGAEQSDDSEIPF
jgi:hypothetical protein